MLSYIIWLRVREGVTSTCGLRTADPLQHSVRGENADDHLPGDRADDLQRLPVDRGGVGITRV